MKTCSISLTVNGVPRVVETPPVKRLLDVLRDDFELTGTKEGCGEGECGACSVIMDGVLVNSCLVPVLHASGSTVRTVEGVSEGGCLHPVQEAFARCGGAQCGICTPGMIMASIYLLEHNPCPTREEIREALAGNLCRCTGYQKIVDAVYEASPRQV
ncbi:MAG: (2Fe-2S)-binding protein [Bryobacteraceae bacterium]